MSMREQLFEEETLTFSRLGSYLSRQASKYLDDGILESYQLATLLMLAQRFGLITVYEFVRFGYDIRSNHVKVLDISTSVLTLLNLRQEDKETFRFTKAHNKLGSRIGDAVSMLSWPKHLHSLIHFCFEDTRLFSILNFVCGCRYWDSYGMYHLILGRTPIPLAEDILTNLNIDPLCYLPDVPELMEDAEEYIELFKKVRSYLPDHPGTGTYLMIEIPPLAGMITSEMWEIGKKLKDSNGISSYRLAGKLREGYLHLMDLSVGIKFVRNSFYDFGVLV